MSRWSLSLLILGVCLTTTEVARAEAGPEASEARARALFERGVAAAAEERFDEAIAAFVESLEAYPHPGTLLNLGLYQLRAGRRVEAQRSLQELLERWGAVISPTARTEVNERLEELERSLARLRVVTSPQGAQLLVAGVEAGQTPLEGDLVLEPGPCELLARLEGFDDARARPVLRPGERSVAELTLTPRPAPPEPQLQPRRPPPPPAVPIYATDPVAEPVPHHRRAWPWLLLGGGAVAAVVTGLLVGLLPRDDQPRPDWTMRVR